MARLTLRIATLEVASVRAALGPRSCRSAPSSFPWRFTLQDRRCGLRFLWKCPYYL